MLQIVCGNGDIILLATVCRYVLSGICAFGSSDLLLKVLLREVWRKEFDFSL